MPKLSSGFRSSSLVFDGAMPMMIDSTIMTAATSGAGDLLNGNVYVPFDCKIAAWFLTKWNNSAGTHANMKLSIGSTTDTDKYMDAVSLASLLATTANNTGKRHFSLPATTVFFNGVAGPFIRAGEIVTFELDALALTATNRISVGLALVPYIQG